MGITAWCFFIITHCHKQRVADCSEILPCSIVCICFNQAQFMIHCAFSHLFGLGRTYIGNADSQTQLQRVGKFHPFLYITAVYEVCRSDQRRVSVLGQHLNGLVQFLEECIVDFFLRIIRNSYLAILTNLGIRDGTVCISHAAHGSNLYDLCNSIGNRIVGILRYLFHCAQVSI